MSARVRVLQYVGGLGPGGTETWLRNTFRVLDRSRLEVSFLVHENASTPYARDIRGLGGEVLVLPRRGGPAWHFAALRRLFAERRFHVVHSHVHLYSGVVLGAAASAGIRERAIHVHTARQEEGSAGRLLYQGAMRAAIRGTATRGFAVSLTAARGLFGVDWRDDPRWSLLYCGVDLGSLQNARPRVDVRAQLGIPPDAFVVGHVGRFGPEKNHAFLAAVFERIRARRADAHLLLVGDGPLRPVIAETIRTRGLSKQVSMPGATNDVASLLNAMDVFALPSHYEGLPLAAVEAFATGLSVFASDHVTREYAGDSEFVKSLPLSLGEDAWAEALVRSPTRQASRVSLLSGGPFDFVTGARILQEYYLASA